MTDLDAIAHELGLPVEYDFRELQKKAHQISAEYGFHDYDDMLQEQLERARAVYDAAMRNEPGAPPESGAAAALKFWEDSHRRYVGNCLMLITGEVAEAHEELRSGRDPNETYFSEGPTDVPKPEGLPSELADIVIRVMDLAHELDINLAHAINLKMRFNQTRPAMHEKVM